MKPEKKNKVRMNFKGIHPSAWEHPADKVALKSLQQVPGLDVAIKAFSGLTGERSLRLIFLASAVRVNKKQFSRVHSLYKETCKTFDVTERPDLFVAQNPFLNASAVGMDNPFIVLNSSMVDILDDEELMALMGHELGHILSGHVLYKTLLIFLVNISRVAMNIPLTGVALFGLIAALREWDRKSELSADRAGLLACQDPEVSIKLLMKMAGGSQIDQMDLGEFIKQAEEYNKGGNLLDNIYKILNMLGRTHPFPVTRLAELLKWVQSGDYDTILRGFYAKEDTEFKEDFKQASEGYKEDIKDTVGPIFDDVKDSAEKASQKAKEFFDDMFKKK